MLRLKPTYDEMLKEAKTKRLKIIPEKERRTQQGILLEDVDFDDFDLDNYNIKNMVMEEDIKRTSEKGVQKSYRPFEDEEPNYKSFPWMYEKIDAEATTIDTMLYRNRDNINQTVRLMLKRNFYTPPSTPSNKPPPSNKSSSQMSDVKDKRHPNLSPSESERESIINKSNSSLSSERSERRSEARSKARSEASNTPKSVENNIKKSTPQPSLPSSSSSSSRSNNLPIESSQSENISVRSSLAPTIQHISSQSSVQTIHSRPSTIQYISD